MKTSRNVFLSAKTLRHAVSIVSLMCVFFSLLLIDTLSVFASGTLVYSITGKKINIDTFVNYISEVNLDTNDNSLDRIIKTPDHLIGRFRWVEESCYFSSDEKLLERYGPFPETDAEFRRKHLSFEMRLCARILSGFIDDSDRLYSKYSNEIEEDIINNAIFCEYNDSKLFSSYALSHLILGHADLKNIKGFSCGDVTKFFEFQHEIDWVLNHFVVEYIYLTNVLGSRSLADKYLEYEKRVIKNRDSQ